jgi:integrase
MTKRRGHGDGGIDQRGPDTFRLRYRVDGKRFTKTFHGTLLEARKELRRLLGDGDAGQHVAPDKIKLSTWIDHWTAAGAPGRRKKRVGRRSLQRYCELLKCHVVPKLGEQPLQQIRPNETDELYVDLEQRVSPRTAHHVHTVFNACLSAAVRTGLLTFNPLARAQNVPSPGESDHGQALDADQLRTLVSGFQGSVLFSDCVRRCVHRRQAGRNSGAALERPRRYQKDAADRARGGASQKATAGHQRTKDAARQTHDHYR